MRDRLIEVFSNFKYICVSGCGRKYEDTDSCNKCAYGQLADYLIKNGVIVPPVMIGQKVWIINSKFDCLNRRFIKFVNEGYVKAIKISMKPMKITIEYPDVNDNKGRCKGADYSATSIGKTVFLTRKEAEAKLKERKEDKK